MIILKEILNNEGYLKNYLDWNNNIAIKIAKKNNIFINKKHWLIIIFIRKFYLKYSISPEINILISFLEREYGKNIGNLKYLKIIFNNNPEELIYKISGISKPLKCLL